MIFLGIQIRKWKSSKSKSSNPIELTISLKMPNFYRWNKKTPISENYNMLTKIW